MSGGKSGGASKQYDYYGTIAGLIGVGPIDGIHAIIIDDTKQWPTSGDGLTRGAETYVDITVPKYGIARVYWGTETQTVPSQLTAAGNNYAEDHPPYKGFAYVLLIDFLLGRERASAPNLEVVVSRKPRQSIIEDDEATLNDGQANPLAWLCEVLGDEFSGLGLSDFLDPASFQVAAAAVATLASRYYISPLIAHLSDAKTALADVQLVTDIWLRWDSQMGKLICGAMPDPAAVVPGDLPEITAVHMVDRPKISTEGWRAVNTQWVVSFSDRDRNYKSSSIKIDNIRARQVVNSTRSETLSRDMVTRKNQAQALAGAWSRVRSVPGNSGTLKLLRPVGYSLGVGDLFRLTLQADEGTYQVTQVCRVTAKVTPPVGAVTIEFSADLSQQSAPYTPSVLGPADDDPEVVPDVTGFRILELPPLLAAKKAYRIAVLAARPNELVTDLDIHYDDVDDGIFPLLGTQRKFSLQGQLAVAYSSSDTGVVTVDLQTTWDRDILELSGAGDKAARNDQLLMFLVKVSESSPYIDIAEDGDGNPLVEVFSVSETAFVSANRIEVTALRARRGTTALSHVITGHGTEAWFLKRDILDDDTVGDAKFFHADFPLLQADGAYAYFRLKPSTASEERELSDCTVRPFRFAGARSYEPLMTWALPVNDSGKNFTTTPAPDALYDYGSTGLGAADTYDGLQATDINDDPFAFDGKLVQIQVEIRAAGTYTFVIAAQVGGLFSLVTSFNVAIATTGTITIPEASIPDINVLAGQYLGIYKDGTINNNYRYIPSGSAVGKNYKTFAGLIGSATTMTDVPDATVMVQGTIRVSAPNVLVFSGDITDRDSDLKGVQLLRNPSDDPAQTLVFSETLPGVELYSLYQRVSFPDAGTYRVTLKMSDGGGRTIERKRTVVVPPAVPVSKVEVAFASPSGGAYFKTRTIAITTDTASSQIKFKWTTLDVVVPPTTGISSGTAGTSTTNTTMQLNKRLWFMAVKSGVADSDWMFEDYYKAT